MRKISILMCIALLFVFSSCSNEEASNEDYYNETSSESSDSSTDDSIYSKVIDEYEDDDGFIIRTMDSKEIALSKIETNEDDVYAFNYREGYGIYNYKPYFDKKGGMYYYVAHDNLCYLYYDDGVSVPVKLNLPSDEVFAAAAIVDDVIYGIEEEEKTTMEELSDGSVYITSVTNKYIERYANGKLELLLKEPVEGCYFAKEGIYYQLKDTINLMDYDGKNSRLITKIPNDIYYESALSNIVVYRGKLWYSYGDADELWCYDFDKTFTMFDLNMNNSEIDAVNNGYIYYTVEDSNHNHSLYRFNCDMYCTELVIDGNEEDYDVGSFAFYKNNILFTATNYTSGDSGLYKLNSQGIEKILSPNKLGKSDGIIDVWCIDDRLFTMGVFELNVHCLAEIDIDGNVLEIIHEDK